MRDSLSAAADASKVRLPVLINRMFLCFTLINHPLLQVVVTMQTDSGSTLRSSLLSQNIVTTTMESAPFQPFGIRLAGSLLVLSLTTAERVPLFR